jgi:DNA-binding NarL/FixJ family response regulator
MGEVVLAVVDGHGFRRAAVIRCLSEWARRHDGRVIGTDAVEPLEAVVRCEASMVVLSVGGSFADPRWEAAIRVLRGLDEERPVVVLSDTETPRDILQAFRAGARGFLPTSLEPEVAFDALSFILRGGAYVPPSVLAACHSPVGPPEEERLLRHDANSADFADAPRAVEPLTGDEAGPSDAARASALGARFSLTQRQSVVLRGLCRGESNKEIARELDMSEATVKVHVRQVLRKLGASNRTQAALIGSGQEAPPPHRPGPSRRRRPSDPPLYGIEVPAQRPCGRGHLHA